MNYNRTIKIKEDKTQEREQAVKVIASIVLVVLVAVLGFKLVARENARDKQVFQNYEEVCGDDYENYETQICLRNLYYKYNKLSD